MYYSWTLLEISVQISFIGHPGDCSIVLCTYKLHGILSWKAGWLCLLGENGSFMELLRTVMPLKEIMQPFHLPFNAHSSARLGNSSTRFDSYGFEIFLRPRLWQGSCRSHGRIVGIKQTFSQCLVGDRKAIVENSPNLRTFMKSRRVRHGCEGKASATLVLSFLFLACPFCSKFPSCYEDLLSWRKWSMHWTVKVDKLSLLGTLTVRKTKLNPSWVIYVDGDQVLWLLDGETLGGPDGYPIVSKSYCLYNLDPPKLREGNPFSA